MKCLLNAPFKLTPDQHSALLAADPGLEIVEQVSADPESLAGDDVTVLVTEQVPRNLGRWPKLRWVQLLSAGANHLLGHPILQSALPVTTASGTHGVPIAQYVTCSALMLVHRMPRLLEFKSTRQWPNRLALASGTLRGRTAGILGYGSIGRECARQLAALGLRIVCLKRDPEQKTDDGFNAWPGTGDPEGRIPEAWFGPAQLAEMLPLSDLLVVTLPATTATEALIGARELALCRPDARLILISRGGIVSETALAEALRSGRIAGAAVDCFVREPLPTDHEFFDVPNLMLTPHMSGIHEDFWPAMNRLLVANLRRFQAGARLFNEVSRIHGY